MSEILNREKGTTAAWIRVAMRDDRLAGSAETFGVRWRALNDQARQSPAEAYSSQEEIVSAQALHTAHPDLEISGKIAIHITADDQAACLLHVPD